MEGVKQSSKFNEHNNYNTRKLLYDILLWKNPITTLAIFFSLITLEISLMLFSVISVMAYMGLTFLICSTSLRLYMRFTTDGSDDNFLQSFLSQDISIAENQSQSEYTNIFINQVDKCLFKLKRLLLIEDYFESFKLALVFYLLTYIGARFNFMTLCITVTIILFFVPKFYQVYQIEIDRVYQLFKRKISTTLSSLGDKLSRLPGIGSFFRASIHED